MVCDDDYLAMCTTDGPKNVFYNEPKTLGNWYRATPPLAAPVVAKLGVADHFGRRMLELKKEKDPDVKVGVIVVSVPGAGIRMFDKDKWKDYYNTVPPENQRGFASFIEMYGSNPYQRMVDCAKIAKKKGVIKGIIMHQGESDYQVPGWNEEVEKIYHDLITDLELPEDLPLVAGEVRRGTVVSDMNLLVNKLPDQNDNFHVVSTQDLSSYVENAGNLHFTSAEYRELGRRYAEKMLEAEKKQRQDDGRDKKYAVLNMNTGEEYRTLYEAFRCADEDGYNELKLLKDVGLSKGSIENYNDVILDMNGFSINLKGHGFQNHGKLIFVNNSDKERVHYFAVDGDSWKIANDMTYDERAAAYDADIQEYAEDTEYIKVRGSLLYNSDGFYASDVSDIDNGFVNCIIVSPDITEGDEPFVAVDGIVRAGKVQFSQRSEGLILKNGKHKAVVEIEVTE
jgi:hypothetical protein